MQIQVIANCQARPITMLVPRVAPDTKMLEPIIVHLSKAEDEAAHLAQMEQADVIFAQLTQDDFQPAHLATKNLKERFGDKVVVWPNIFYMGQQPYLRYFTHATTGRMMGPMEAMHDLRLYNSWKVTGRVDPAVITQSDSDFIAAIRKTSLAQLEAKEKKCDVAISDFLTVHENNERLFFTFNHPTQLVLLEMARRMFAIIGKPPPPPGGTNDQHPESLNRYQVPSVWDQKGVEYQGDQYVSDPVKGPTRLPGRPQRYTLEELCEAYQKTYDAHEVYQTTKDIRFTPSTVLDKKILTGR